MSSIYGEHLKLSVFGQSHAPAIGMTLDGIPAGLPVDMEALEAFLRRRTPGNSPLATPRKEGDTPRFLCGIVDGHTCGAPITAVIENTNTRLGDYDELRDCPRPGHADYTAQVRYGGFQDVSGGGHFSGRLTAPMCIAGGLCMQWLSRLGIRVGAHIACIAGVWDEPMDPVSPGLDYPDPCFPVWNREAGEKMKVAILDAKSAGDSVGGVIECAVTGLPAGLGEPVFGGVEGRLSSILYAIPAVKGVEFGAGFRVAQLRGSENNDPFRMENGVVRTGSNHCGGILGGITNAMPLIFRIAVKPTPSIAMEQRSVSLSRGENRTLKVGGRHDPCIVPRAVPVAEAAAAVGVMDMILERQEIGKWI